MQQHTGYCDIMVAKEDQWLLRKYLKNALLLVYGCRVVWQHGMGKMATGCNDKHKPHEIYLVYDIVVAQAVEELGLPPLAASGDHSVSDGGLVQGYIGRRWQGSFLQFEYGGSLGTS